MTQKLFLLRELVRRDVQGRYAGSALGLLWSVLQPLWLLLLFTFVFATVLKIPLTGQRTENFAIFLFCGLLPWTAISEGLNRSATAITDGSELVKKLSFPSELLVATVVLAALVQEAIAAVIFLAVLIWSGDFAWGGLPLLAVALPLQIALTLGLGLILASAQVFFRDIAQLLGMVLTGWFYFTPIVYPLEMVPESVRSLVALNPLTALVELSREAFLGGGLESVAGLRNLVILAVVLNLFGFWLFRRLKPTFADEI